MILQEHVDHVLIDQERLQARISELAGQVSRDYAGVDNLLLVCVLKDCTISYPMTKTDIETSLEAVQEALVAMKPEIDHVKNSSGHD